MKKIILSLLIVLFVGIQCYGEGEVIEVKRGVTTKDEITEAFGQPYLIEKIDGKECWFYKSGDSKRLPIFDNTLIFIQFSNEGIVEDDYVTTEKSKPFIKPKNSQQLLRKGQWAENLKKYGPPEEETYSENGGVWSYKVGEQPTIDKYTKIIKIRNIVFDNDGNFVRECESEKIQFKHKPIRFGQENDE